MVRSDPMSNARVGPGRNGSPFRCPPSSTYTPPTTPNLTPRKTLEELAEEPGTMGSEARFLLKLKGVIGKIAESDRAFFVDFASKLGTPKTT